jgi:hypothetical protein
VIELPSSSSSGLLPVKMKRLEFERPSTSQLGTTQTAAADSTNGDNIQVDLLDEYYDSDETWDIENAEERIFLDEYEEDEEEEESENTAIVDSENKDSLMCNDDVSAINRRNSTTAGGGGAAGNSGGGGGGQSGFRAGRIVHLYDLLPHPRLSPEEIYLIERHGSYREENQPASLLRPSFSAPPAASTDNLPIASTSAAPSSTAEATTFSTSNEPPSIKKPSQSLPLPKGSGAFPSNSLSKSLRPGMYEIWAILEFADLGSMEDHVVKKNFLRHFDGTHDQESILRLLLDVARGMVELHKHTIIHTDLKPSNIMFVSSSTDPRGWVAKISDAGLLPLLDLTLTYTSIRHHSRMQCLPPELVLNNATTAALDVYCFAMLMWKTWTCERPFKHMSIGCFFEKVIENGERPGIPEGCPAAYAELMQKCWLADPAARPSFEFICGELEKQLEHIISLKTSPN